MFVAQKPRRSMVSILFVFFLNLPQKSITVRSLSPGSLHVIIISRTAGTAGLSRLNTYQLEQLVHLLAQPSDGTRLLVDFSFLSFQAADDCAG